MSHLPAKAQRFNSALAAISSRLSEHRLVVSRMHADWGSFGSWQIHLERGGEADVYSEAMTRGEYENHGPEVLRCTWDGRDRVLLLAVGRTPSLTSPLGWQSRAELRCEDGFAALEEVVPPVLEWAGGDA